MVTGAAGNPEVVLPREGPKTGQLGEAGRRQEKGPPWPAASWALRMQNRGILEGEGANSVISFGGCLKQPPGGSQERCSVQGAC